MSDLVMVSETVELPQGVKAVKDVLVGVVQKLHNGVGIAELVVGELADLEKVISALSEIPADLKSGHVAVAMGLLAGQLGDVLLSPKPGAAAPASSVAAPASN